MSRPRPAAGARLRRRLLLEPCRRDPSRPRLRPCDGSRRGLRGLAGVGVAGENSAARCAWPSGTRRSGLIAPGRVSLLLVAGGVAEDRVQRDIGEYLLAGGVRPRASAIARTWCGAPPQQMPMYPTPRSRAVPAKSAISNLVHVKGSRAMGKARSPSASFRETNAGSSGVVRYSGPAVPRRGSRRPTGSSRGSAGAGASARESS